MAHDAKRNEPKRHGEQDAERREPKDGKQVFLEVNDRKNNHEVAAQVHELVRDGRAHIVGDERDARRGSCRRGNKPHHIGFLLVEHLDDALIGLWLREVRAHRKRRDERGHDKRRDNRDGDATVAGDAISMRLGGSAGPSMMTETSASLESIPPPAAPSPDASGRTALSA